MFTKIFSLRIMRIYLVVFLLSFPLSVETNAQYDASVKINEIQINNILAALVEAHGVNFGDYTGDLGLQAWYVNVDAATANIQPNNIITLSVNLALVAEIDIFLFSFPAVDHQQLSISGRIEIQGDLQTGYKLIFIHDPISVSFYGVNINAFPDNIEINLGSSILPESLSSLFTSGIPQITTNENEIIFGFNFQGPRFFTFKNNFDNVGDGGVINVSGTQCYSPTSVEITAGNPVTVTAVDQTISGINYTFINWSNGSTSRTTTFTQEGSYTANFVKPISATMSGPSSLSNGQSGTFTVTATGGKSPYTYNWSYYVHCNEVLSLSASTESGEITPDAVPCGSWFSIYNTTNTVTRTSDGRTFDIKCIVTDANNSTYTVTKTVAGSGAAMMKESINESAEVAIENENYPESLETNPNPFNPTTKISFSIPNAGHVSLKVYDILGREVAELANKTFSTGRYEFEFNASNLPSGVYITALVTEKSTLTKKIMLVK